MYSYTGDTILDPYAGTCATTIAACQCGRKSVGFEIDKDCEVLTRKRLEFELKRDKNIKIPDVEFIAD